MASPASSTFETYVCREQATVTDWQGNVLPRSYIAHLGIGCTVRIVVDREERDAEEGKGGKASECIYVDITELHELENGNKAIKGIVQDIYRSYPTRKGRDKGGEIGVVSGQEIAFETRHINEIPLAGWQPGWYLEETKDLKPMSKHVGMTGWR